MSRAPYRQQASALQGPTESKLSPDRSLCVFDVSGRPGRRAADGHAGGAGHRSGADGGPGGHAGPAEPGQGAGRLELRWAASGDGLLRVTGDGARPDGFEASIDQVVAFGDEGFVDVTACGGRGGDGGQGGRGGDGARGYSGSDATRYSSGSSGGPGGDGGPGGRGSSGARGGDGGQIRVRVGDEDTHLLMLLREHVGGGGGGVPGRNGSGGSGGAGGAGGSSYSWTESESYTDSQGQSQSRTTWHSNPGGSSGSSGRDGPAGGARLEGGAAGRAGAFSIEVEGAAGTARYGSRYHLELASFRHESENQDGICEPQEKVRVFDIEIDNVGGMPTPRTRDVELYLARRGWVRPLPQKLVLQHDIAAGERCKVGAGALEFEIGDYVPQGPGDALACEERIGFVAQVPAVRRSFGLFDGAASERCGRFLIRFPVEATGVEGLPSLAPGQAARVRFAVRNVSSRAFGSASELGRAVRVRLFVKHSEVARGEVTIEELDRTACDSEGFVRDLERLEAGEVRRFEAVVSVGAGAEHYRAVRFWLELSLGTISEPATLRTVQIGALDLRVAQRYAPRPGSHVLLCVNHATSRELLDAWRAAAGRLGLELNVWDASLEGGIDFQRRLPDGGSLLDAYAGQSVVVLNNAIQTPDGPSYPHRQVALGDLVALVRTGARVLFVGKKPPLGDIATAATEAPAADAPGAALALRPASDTRALVASLAALASDGSHPAPIVVEERIRRSRWYVPRERDLRARALELTRAAMAALPGQRWLVVERFDPELVERGVLRHRFRLGTLEIRPGLATVGAVIHSAATDDALADPDAVGGPSSLVDLLLTRSFDDRLDRLATLSAAVERAGSPRAAGEASAEAGEGEDAGGEGERSPELRLLRLAVDSLLVELLREQQALLVAPWRAGLSRAELQAAMPCLQAFAARAFGGSVDLAVDAPLAKEVLRGLGRLSFYGRVQPDWWERLPPFRFWRRTPVVASAIADAVDVVLGRVFGGEGDEAKKRLRLARRGLATKLAVHRKRFKTDNEAGFGIEEFARQTLAWPIDRPGFICDAELRDEVVERVLTGEELDAMVARDQKRARQRQRLAQASEQAQASLLLS